jgi:hypothetical protein
VLRNVALPEFFEKEGLHRHLALLAEEAHRAARGGDVAEVARIEGEVDELAARLWQLSATELGAIKRSLEEA